MTSVHYNIKHSVCVCVCVCMCVCVCVRVCVCVCVYCVYMYGVQRERTYTTMYIDSFDLLLGITFSHKLQLQHMIITRTAYTHYKSTNPSQ